MLIDRYAPEDVFARVPELAGQTDPSIAAKNSPKVPLQKSPGVGNFRLAFASASLKIPRTSVL